MSINDLAVALKHLPGQHPQKTHGHGAGGVGSTPSGNIRGDETLISKNSIR